MALFVSLELASTTDEKAATVEAALHEVAAAVGPASPGTLMYNFFKSGDKSWSLRELYSNERSFLAHLGPAKEALDKLVPASDAKLTFLVVAGDPDALSDETKKVLAGFGAEVRKNDAGFVLNPIADVKSDI